MTPNVEPCRLPHAWEALVNSLNGIVWEADPATSQCTFISRQAERLLGYPVERWLTEPGFWQRCLHPEDRDRVRAAACQALAEQCGPELEYRFVAADGRTVWVHDLATVVVESGRPVAVRGVMVDITERKRAEEALRESEERHRVISELTSDYAYTCRITADGEAVLDSVTAGFPHVTGYTLEEVTARGGWMSFIHPEDLPEAHQRAESILRGERGVNELRIVTKSGTVRWIRYSTQPVWCPTAGRVVRLLGAVQDVTERKETEETLRDYAQRLQTLSRRLLDVQEQERRHLARELHDEIGQLLTGLKFSIETCGWAAADARVGHLKQAQGLVKELTTRVRDLSMRLRPTMLDDLGLLPALLWHFERYTAQTGVHVVFEHRGLDDRLAAEVETAAYRIVQEGLTNAARHAGVDEVTVRLWRDPAVLGLQVEDRGGGFDADWRLLAGTSSGVSGMQERAVLLGGYLAVESAPGKGTRLTAELPIRSE